jgi:hypothetical protein
MPEDAPTFSIQQLKYGGGYVVIAMWPDGRSEQLVGVYWEARHAQRWIDERGDEWRRAHDPNRDGAGPYSR